MNYAFWNLTRRLWRLKKQSESNHLSPFDFFKDCQRFWRTHNDQLLLTEQQSSQLANLRAAYAADSATLEKLERTNVYNDAFCIGHDGVFGTINGLRLGRVSGVPVSQPCL